MQVLFSGVQQLQAKPMQTTHNYSAVNMTNNDTFTLQFGKDWRKLNKTDTPAATTRGDKIDRKAAAAKKHEGPGKTDKEKSERLLAQEALQAEINKDIPSS